MWKLFLFLCLFLSHFQAYGQIKNNLIDKPYYKHPLDNMPIMEPTPEGFAGNIPEEQRGIEFRKFLSASVKIDVTQGSGSGTIVYYDSSKNLAYVATCGHLWTPGTMSAEQGAKKNLKCKITTWYHNEEKLNTPRSYQANVIFYSYITGQDTALLTFTPDWTPNYFPIAPEDYKYLKNHVHSCGCDSGGEVAHYDVEIMGLGRDLVTYQNSPRPGRSGGGLMDDNGYYIATCWGTEFVNGSGKGFFTPLTTIHRYWNQQTEYKFLLNQSLFARQIPIVDRLGIEDITYPSEYILIPN